MASDVLTAEEVPDTLVEEQEIRPAEPPRASSSASATRRPSPTALFCIRRLGAGTPVTDRPDNVDGPVDGAPAPRPAT
jgi:hypothetical protein